MTILFFLFLQLTPAGADLSERVVLESVPVKQRPSEQAKVLFHLQSGDQIQVSDDTKGEPYLQIRQRVPGEKGKWRVGYMASSDFDKTQPRPKQPPVKAGRQLKRKWAFGGGVAWTYLSHKGRNFQTDDQVEYSTKPYTSTTFNPALTVQYGWRKFWRLHLGLKSTNYVTHTESSNLGGDRRMDVSLEHNFWMANIQRGWSLNFWSPLYFGVGVELAKGNKVTLRLDNAEYPTTDDQLPFYTSAQLLTGLQFELGRRFSYGAEVRGVVVVNQSPLIYGSELFLYLMYWL